MKLLERFWSRCGHCHGQETCPLVQAAEKPEQQQLPFGSGSSMVAASACVFLIPLATAIAGAYFAARYLAGGAFGSIGLWHAVGLLTGLASGAAIAKALLYLAQRKITPSNEAERGPAR